MVEIDSNLENDLGLRLLGLSPALLLALLSGGTCFLLLAFRLGFVDRFAAAGGQLGLVFFGSCGRSGKDSRETIDMKTKGPMLCEFFR